MSNYRKSKDAIARLSPEQFRITQESGTERPGTGELSQQQGARHLRRHCLRRASVRVDRQIRLRLGLAQLHPAHRARACGRVAGRIARHGPG